jgi:hypothetical protein
MSSSFPGPSPSASKIPVLASDRSQELSERRPRRGANPTALARGQAASDAIRDAKDETDRYRAELDRVRALLGQHEDKVRDFNAILAANGAAAGVSFALPPDPVTSELLHRDRLIFEWAAAHRAEVARSAAAAQAHQLERDDLLQQISNYKSQIELRDCATQLLAQADKAEASAVAECATKLAELQLKHDRLAAQFEEQKHALTYYTRAHRKAQSGELDARRAEARQRDRTDEARATSQRLQEALSLLQFELERRSDGRGSAAGSRSASLRSPTAHGPSSPAASRSASSVPAGTSRGATPPSPESRPRRRSRSFLSPTFHDPDSRFSD